MNAPPRLLRWAQRFFLWLGTAALIYVAGTVAYAGVYQRYQSWKFEQMVVSTVATRQVPVDPVVDLREGEVVGRLEAPRIGLSLMVFQGVGEGILTVGAGHVPGTPLPGADGNIAIAAHRDTFFRKLEGIRPGDAIHLATVLQTYEFIVGSTEIVDPDDVQVMESHGRSELTLITCYPFYFVGAAPQRFIVHATPLR